MYIYSSTSCCGTEYDAGRRRIKRLLQISTYMLLLMCTYMLLRHRGRRRAAADQEVARMRVSVHKARDENLVRKQVDHELCRSVAAEARRL